jgi:hypothetical protein
MLHSSYAKWAGTSPSRCIDSSIQPTIKVPLYKSVKYMYISAHKKTAAETAAANQRMLSKQSG